MTRIVASVVAVLMVATSFAAQASLIGSTVVYTNPNPILSGTFTVGDGPEESVCLLPFGPLGAGCVLSFEVDYGADYITTHLTNTGDVGYATTGVTTASSVFGPGVNIAAISVDSNFPDVYAISFTSNSITSVLQPWVWAAHSDYLTTVHVTTVPEPSTLSMLGAGLLGLAALRRRRTAA